MSNFVQLRETSDGAQSCIFCGTSAKPAESVPVRCNVRRFREQVFTVWRCSRCRSLHCETVNALESYYVDYPIRKQELNYFLRAWYRVVLRRLQAQGLQRSHAILDYGCSKGLLIRFLSENGFKNVSGYDPYVPAYSDAAVLERKFDCVISLDVIEHDLNPSSFLQRLAGLTSKGGIVCIETPNADGIALSDTEEYLHSLHTPYHVHIASESALRSVAETECELSTVDTHLRWYMDAWLPGTSRRLFEPLMTYSGNDIDTAYESPRYSMFFRHPQLLFYLFFGYWLPSRKTDHMMLVFRRN